MYILALDIYIYLYIPLGAEIFMKYNIKQNSYQLCEKTHTFPITQ